jgi:hypothetical protein
LNIPTATAVVSMRADGENKLLINTIGAEENLAAIMAGVLYSVLSIVKILLLALKLLAHTLNGATTVPARLLVPLQD